MTSKRIIFLTLLSISAAIPPRNDYPRMARYIVHAADWLAISTISTSNNIKGYPFVNLKSYSDGPVEFGNGMPYLYLTDMDFTGKDIIKDPRCSILISLAATDYCKTSNFDPQDPRCARVLISGSVVKLDAETDEYKYGYNALISRHPVMQEWPPDHQFYVAKIDIQQIYLLDYFGGANNVSVYDYFNLPPKHSHRPKILVSTNSMISLE